MTEGDYGVGQVTHRYSRRLPRTSSLIPILVIIPVESGPNQVRISKPSSEHSRGSPKFPNQNLRQIGQGVPQL